MSRLRLFAVALALLVAACSFDEPPTKPPRTVFIGPLTGSWTMFRGDPARDGHPFGVTLTREAAARLSLGWSVDAGAPVDTGPVVAAGLVVVGTEAGTLAGYSTEQGKQVWQVTGLGPLTGQLLIYGGNVYAGSSDGRLYAFELQTGDRIWDWRAPGLQPAIGGGPVVFQGLLLVGVGSQPGDQPREAGRLVALDPASGDRVWSSCLLSACGAGDGILSSVAIDPSGVGFVGVGNPDDALAGFDAGLGRLRWKNSLYLDAGRGVDVTATPLVFRSGDRERVAVGGTEGSFGVFEAASGIPVWTRQLVSGSPLHGLAGSPAFDGLAIYVPSAGSPGGLLAVNPDTGAIRWRDESPVPVFSSPAVGLGVVVYGEGSAFGAGRGAMVAVSNADGSELWRFPTDAAVVASPALAGEAVYVADRSGRLMAFRP